MTKEQKLIWDLPTRVFHWMLVLSFAGAWLAFDDDRYLYIHVYSGYVLLALLIFRLLWGVIGSHYARFYSFAHSWPSATAYIKALLTGQAARYVGHNPAGSWAIFLMLLLGFAVTLTGMFTLGGEERHGLFVGLMSIGTGFVFHEIHEVLAWTMLVVVAVHLVGVIVESLYHRENLIMAMFTGHKEGGGDDGVHVRPWSVVAVVLMSAIVASSFFTFRGYLGQTEQHPFLPFAGIVLPDNDTWREECGDCHMAYHPSLLPARSWVKLMDEQHDHFGDDLDLDDDDKAEITDFLVQNSAEYLLVEPSWRILTETPANETPMRVTETHYWKRKHAEIEQRYWDSKKVMSKGNCPACHLDARAGTYEDADMHLPHL